MRSFQLILWMPSFYGSPDVSHLGPDSGATTFTAVLSDYRYAESVAYHWACDDANVVIATPNARETAVTFTSMPSWRSARLTVTTAVGTNELCSVLDLTYGTNETPQVSFDFSAPEAVLLNSNRTDNAKLRRMSLSLSSDAERSGQVQLSCLSGNDRIALWGTSNRTSRISLPQIWNAAAFTNFEAYVEGCVTSGALGDVRLKAEYLPEDDDPTEIVRDLTVVEIGEVSLPGAPDDGLVISTGSSVLLSVDCWPSAAGSLLSTTWETCRLKSDATYDSWVVAVAHSGDNESAFVPSRGGIYAVRVAVSIDGAGVDKREYRWNEDEIDGFGIREAGNLKAFGVVDQEWQKTLRNCAKGYFTDTDYGRSAALSSRYGFSRLPTRTWKCNMFVAHRLCECGFSVPSLHTYRLRPLPPLANEWAGGTVIPDWVHTSPSEYVQPGWIVAHPNPEGSGHVGIVDFDGAGIAAGTIMVNRASPDFISGHCVYRKYIATEQ